jgi:hypothetical protein
MFANTRGNAIRGLADVKWNWQLSGESKPIIIDHQMHVTPTRTV